MSKNVYVAAAELDSLQADAEQWRWAKACAVDEDDGGFILYPGTALPDRDFDPDAEAFQAAVDAAIAKKGQANET